MHANTDAFTFGKENPEEDSLVLEKPVQEIPVLDNPLLEFPV